MLKSLFVTFATLALVSNVFAGTTTYAIYTVVNVENVYEVTSERFPSRTYTEWYCEDRSTHSGSTIGAVAGGIGGFALGRGNWKILTTPLGIGLGSNVGGSFDRHGPKICREYPVTIYQERPVKVFIERIVTLNNGDTFSTKDRYDVGDKVRKKITEY